MSDHSYVVLWICCDTSNFGVTAWRDQIAYFHSKNRGKMYVCHVEVCDADHAKKRCLADMGSGSGSMKNQQMRSISSLANREDALRIFYRSVALSNIFVLNKYQSIKTNFDEELQLALAAAGTTGLCPNPKKRKITALELSSEHSAKKMKIEESCQLVL